MEFKQHNNALASYMQAHRTGKYEKQKPARHVQSLSAPVGSWRSIDGDEHGTSEAAPEKFSELALNHPVTPNGTSSQRSVSDFSARSMPGSSSAVHTRMHSAGQFTTEVKSRLKTIQERSASSDLVSHKTLSTSQILTSAQQASFPSSSSSSSAKSKLFSHQSVWSLNQKSTAVSSVPKLTRRSSSSTINGTTASVHKVVKPSFNTLPDELALKIFNYLTPGDLLSSARVCRHWLRLMNDNVLWHDMYLKYVPENKQKKEAITTTLCRPPLYWKQKCLNRPDNFSPERILRQLAKLHRFTGLPVRTQPILEKLSMKWVLTFVNIEGQETSVSFHSDSFFFQMALCIRWYNSDMKINGCKRLRLYAARPVFRDGQDKPLSSSPCRRSLLMDVEFPYEKLLSSLTPIAEDKILSLYSLENGILYAVWKDGRDLAFVTISLHANTLVQRCIMGDNNREFVAPRCTVLRDDLDAEYGLHSYSCTFELRNFRNSLWSQQFGNIFCHRRDIVDGWAVFTLIDPQKSYERSSMNKKISMPWKTLAFTGKLPNVCILDCTVLDEQKNPMWCKSLVGVIQKSTNGNLRYEYDGNDIDRLHFTDGEQGRIDAHLIWVSHRQHCSCIDSFPT